MASRRLAKGAGRAGAEDALAELRMMANPRNVEGMARFGINPERALGVPMADLKPLAKRLGRDHGLALALWEKGVREARVLAFLVDEPAELTEGQMEAWAAGFDSWDVCDGCCMHLFAASPLAWPKAVEWSRRDEEFVKRAGYVLMAVLAVHDRASPDSRFASLFTHIRRGAADGRAYVVKAVNWALRQIGKRNRALNEAAAAEARRMLAIGTPQARWIARDALRELESPKVREMLSRRAARAATARRASVQRAMGAQRPRSKRDLRARRA